MKTIALQLSDFSSPDEVCEVLEDNEIFNYEGKLDIICDLITLKFNSKEEMEIACDIIIDSFNVKVQQC
jgi:hypothetical protein